jgi:hypothetical protein
VECLDNYRKTWSKQLGQWTSVPLHNYACVTGDTKVFTDKGVVPILALPFEGRVLTPCGWKQFYNPRITRRSVPIVAVMFEDGFTVRCTEDHLFLTASGWKFARDLRKGMPIRSSLTLQRSISVAAYIAFGRVKGILRVAVEHFMLMYGKVFMVSARRAATSIIRTIFHPTISWITSNACRSQSTWRSHGSALAINGQMVSVNVLRSDLRSGIGPKKDENGTQPLIARSFGENGNTKNADALFAGVFLIASSEAKGTFKNTVPSLVGIRHTMVGWLKRGKLSLKSLYAWNVKSPFSSNGTERERKAKSFAPEFACNDLRIKNVQLLSQAEDVWCLTVNDPEHWWTLANGAITHNSNAADAGMCGAVGLKPDGIWLADGSRAARDKKKVRGSQWAQ